MQAECEGVHYVCACVESELEHMELGEGFSRFGVRMDDGVQGSHLTFWC